MHSACFLFTHTSHHSHSRIYSFISTLTQRFPFITPHSLTHVACTLFFSFTLIPTPSLQRLFFFFMSILGSLQKMVSVLCFIFSLTFLLHHAPNWPIFMGFFMCQFFLCKWPPICGSRSMLVQVGPLLYVNLIHVGSTLFYDIF